MRSLLLIVLAVVAVPVFAQKTHAKISPAQAAKVATRKYPGKIVNAPKLEHEDGRWQYEVIVRQGKTLREINVDANTGRIASVERTSAAEEAREHKKGE